MKVKNYIVLIVLAFSLAGCFVLSFYPIYSPKDLFPNSILLGNWLNSDSSEWRFEYRIISEKSQPLRFDSTSYLLTIREKEKDWSNSKLEVKVVKLEGHYFLDFYLNDYYEQDPLDVFGFHLLPVHTFAKLNFENDSLSIKWYDPQWIEQLLKEKKLRIKHEANGTNILLTAKTKELQKFIVKYVGSEEAFKDGVTAELKKMR